MNTLIDGYNLIFAVGFISDRESPTRFEKARRRLLRVLSSRMTTEQRRDTLIVFDAANAPPGLPDAFEEEQIGVRFAVGYAEADDLIEVLIRQHSTPKKLLVVSSDHRIQRAAAARKAKHLDSQDWFDRLPPPPSSSNPPNVAAATNMPANDSPAAEAMLSAEEVAQWIDDIESPAAPKKIERRRDKPKPSKPKAEEPVDNPFPPGYADDLFDTDDA